MLRQCTFPSVDVLNSFFFQFTSILFLFSLHRREGVFTGGGGGFMVSVSVLASSLCFVHFVGRSILFACAVPTVLLCMGLAGVSDEWYKLALGLMFT